MVLAAACVTLFGLGAFDRAVATYDPTAWLFSQSKGELGRVNGDTARVDTRVKVQGTIGHKVEVSQTDQYLIVRDDDTGMVSSLDLATLQIAASLATPPGAGVRVLVHGKTAFVLDEVHGQVRQVDPTTLKPVGAVLNLSPGMVDGGFDSDGKLWLALTTQGTVVSLTPGAKAGDPPTVQTQSVAQPGHDLQLSVLDKGAAVLDETADQLVTVRGNQITRTALNLTGPGFLASQDGGGSVAVTVPGSRQVDGVTPPTVSQFSVPGNGNTLSPAVSFAGWYYVPDKSANLVYVLDQTGALTNKIQFPAGSGDLQLQIQGDHLYINAPSGGTAVVVDKSHKASTVNKYPGGVLGAPPPLAPPTVTPTKGAPSSGHSSSKSHQPGSSGHSNSSNPGSDQGSSSSPQPPQAGPPGAPTSVVASAGNASARLSWGAAPSDGSPIQKYVVSGGGQNLTFGADQRAASISNLTNGQTYTFSVYAVNAKGNGPTAQSNPVVPTNEVPSPPTSVAAEAKSDGSVSVSWPAGNGQGHKVASYQVTANGPGGPAQTWQVDGTKTSLTTPAGALSYGTQYAFTVSTVNDAGASSKASPMSPSVVPYGKPDAPGSITVAPNGKAGQLLVRWSAAATNGRALTGYEVYYNGTSKTVSGSTTSLTLTGLGNGKSVSVQVAAINDAGTSAKGPAKAAATIAAPAVTIGTITPGYNQLKVAFTVNDGGDTATCSVSLSNGGGTKSGSCTSLTVAGLAPGVSYTATVSAKNVAGTGTRSKSAKTTVLKGTVTCINPPGDTYCTTIGIYNHPAQQTQYTVKTSPNGTRYQAYCQIAGGVNKQTSNTTTVNSAQYNKNKKSTKWVKISTSAEYIPYAWFNLDGGDDLSLLPSCS
ncbi:hypothetical protein GCM10023322_39990 [Rugosimonospora acidiphila]|uniref:Fibronectin type-III domain-containing protein n=1 Tax=Rugosimonospora acidiphila TaxID=556531 RepID=A0ABP9RYI6_9ACTN